MARWTKKDEAAYQRLEPIRKAGYDAAVAGQPWEACPYDFELMKRSAWLTGHQNWRREQARAAASA